MQNYDLNRLGDRDFETLVQALLKQIIGPGTTTFGDGPDGGREATYRGKAPYPSPNEVWDGEWIFQAKFHDVARIGPDKARQAVMKDLKSELDKIVNKYKRKCDNYILATNVPLSSVAERGTHDQIATLIVPEYLEHIPHIHVWGYDDLARFIENCSDVRKHYFHFLTPGDLIAELMAQAAAKKSELSTIMQLYLRVSFDNEQYAQLDQAGDVDAKQLHLRSIFIDLNVSARSQKDLRLFLGAHPEPVTELHQFVSAKEGESFSACKALAVFNLHKSVLIGGPGQGKSTLCQFIAQIHRAHLLQRWSEMDWSETTTTPLQLRLPFRVILKDYAQWIATKTGPVSLESFIAFLVHDRTARSITPEQVQDLIQRNPTLPILDGLDEVTDRELRQKLLGLVNDFIARAEVLKSDLQLICTSRPTGYTDQFDPTQFIHLVLASLDRPKIVEYTTKWVKAKKLEDAKGKALLASVSDCLSDPNFSSLMNTPLQVTIFILIILSGGTPPRQREELFNEYLEVIYKRERSKSKAIIQTEKRLLFGLHQYLGYVLHHRAAVADTRSKVSEVEFRTAVVSYLRHDDPYSPNSELTAKAEQIIQEAHERLVLLVQPADGFFGFELRSIQEFFAAGYLVDTAADNAQRFERFQAVAIPPHWRNVALFFAGRVGRLNRGESAHILETCRDIDRYKPDLFVRKGAWLALDIAVDRSFGPARQLQRSALEIALGMLEGDFSPERRNDMLLRLRQLPPSDVQQHVVPLLRDKLSKAHMDDGFAVPDVLTGVSSERGCIEGWFLREVSITRVPPHILLRKALRYRLTPAFIASHLKIDVQDALTLTELTIAFSIEPKLVVEVLEAARVDARVAPVLCVRAQEYSSYMPVDQLPVLELPESMFEQSVLARKLFVCAVGMRRYNRRPKGFGAQDTTLPQLEALLSLITHPDADLVLKAAAWSVACPVLLLRNRSTELQSLAAEVNKWDRDDVAKLESILERTGSPSLEFLTRLGGRISGPLGRSSPGMLFGIHNERDFLSWALSGMGLDDCLSVVNAIGSKKGPKRKKGPGLEEEVILLRLGVRTGECVFYTEPKFTVSTISMLLDIIASAVVKDDPAAWRTLEKLSFKWHGEVDQKMQLSLRKLCISLEKYPSPLPAPPLVGLVTCIAALPGTDRYLLWLLRIMKRMEEPAGDTPHRFWQDVRKSVITRLVKTANDEASLVGLAKWFSWLNASLQPGAPHTAVDMPKLRIEKSGLLKLAETEQGDARSGALTILAHTASLTYSEAQSLLKSNASEWEMHECWSDLIEGTVRNSDDSEAIGFLEEIVSSASIYPKVVRYAALAKYEKVARSSTIDILKQESRLGLPFQDVLRLKPKQPTQKDATQ